MEKIWKVIPTDPERVRLLQQALNIHPVFCSLLVQRGVSDYEEARQFFRPSLDHLHDPFLMADMEGAVARLETAIQNGERILLYGDYDVDGTTAVALSYAFLSKYHSNLDYYIPDRYKEGYGVSMDGIDYARQNGVSLIIAMDCGVKAIQQVAFAKSHGIDFIICDHHLPKATLPEAVAVLDPKRPDCAYPYKELSGCGVVFKLCQAFAKSNDEAEASYLNLLDLLVVSIACDIVPVTGENRILAYYGLQRLNERKRLGLRALLDLANRTGPLRISDIVFGIGPMINAAGRLADARLAVKLLLSENKNVAYEYAHNLNHYNRQRREFEKGIVREAAAMYEALPDHETLKSLVLFQPGWHKGVVGIAAAKMVEQFYKPSIMLTESNGKLVGSARTVRGFDIHRAIQACEPLLDNFGGHVHAAGLTLRPENLGAFQEKFEAVVAAQLSPQMEIPEIAVAAEIPIEWIGSKFYKLLKQMAPFGPGNRNPVFVSRFVMDAGFSRVLKDSHLRLSIQRKGKEPIAAIAFGMGHLIEKVKSGAFHLCYTINENHWQGKKSLQLNVKDIQFPD
ncbi:MAG: single-stranded-DNA-specific exonuclease RecJ [Bacteroidota bacterium]